jgi:hypothetical protein
MSKVVVIADKNGNIIGQSTNNPEYGYIRVQQQTVQISEQGWLKTVKRSAILKGKMEDLLSAEYREGTQLPGKIVVVEALEPFNPTNPDKDLKIAGDTGIICRVEDQPIYRNSFYTSNPNAYDELISHTNSDEIKDVMEAKRVITTFGEPSREAAL